MESNCSRSRSQRAPACWQKNVPCSMKRQIVQTRRPFVVAKCGITLDGRLSPPPRETCGSPAASAATHSLACASRSDLIGAETLRADNHDSRSGCAARQPWRIVLSRSGALPRARLFTDRFAARTIVYGENLDVSAQLGEKEITSVLIEGGGEIPGQALDQRLVDKVQLYVGPILTGGPVVAFPGIGAASTKQAPRLDRVRYERIGQDICVVGYPTNNPVSFE